MSEEPTAYDTMAECYRRGSETHTPNPTTDHVVIHDWYAHALRAIALITDLRDEVAKLRRTVAAQELPASEGITDDLLCRFRAMLERAYPRRGKNESVESWRARAWAFYTGIAVMETITSDMARRAFADHELSEDEFDRTIRQGGVLRPGQPWGRGL